MRYDPYAHLFEDPTGILDYLIGKGYTVNRPVDPNNLHNKPIPVCANPECSEMLIDRPSALYCKRGCKEKHTQAKRVAAREASARSARRPEGAENADETEGYVRAVMEAAGGADLQG